MIPPIIKGLPNFDSEGFVDEIDEVTLLYRRGFKGAGLETSLIVYNKDYDPLRIINILIL